MTNLMRASRQWQTRPDDERFESIDEMIQATRDYRMNSRTAKVQSEDLAIDSEGSDLFVVGKTGTKALLTHFSFGQIAQRASAPPGYLRSLPSDMAVSCLNHGLRNAEKEETSLLLAKDGEGFILRAATSDRYTRIWNHEVLERVSTIGDCWRAPPARPVRNGQHGTRKATEADVLRFGSHNALGVKVGDEIAPAGLYASDRDMFVFMVDDEKRIEVDGASLCRGFFLWNSEVGQKSLGIQTFLFDAVCGNHIIWGAQNVSELRIRHSGEADTKWFGEVSCELTKYADSSTTDDVMRIESARTFRIGKDRESVVDALFGKKTLLLSKGTVDDAYSVVERTPRYGDPRSAWGIAQGLTELSQKSTHTDERVKLDRAAGKVLEMAF